MRKELIETGRTVDEAIDNACAKLGAERDNIEFEILDLPKKSFLGLKTSPARVKVWTEVPDEQPKAAPAPAPRPAAAPVQQPKPQPQQPKAEKPAQEKPTAPQKELALTGDVAKKADAAIAYLDGVCKQMGLAATFVPSVMDGGLLIQVEGEGLGAMIGRRGETLDALQYLSSLVANRLEGDYLRLTVDCGGYRSKRKVTLEALAKKLSAQVLKTNTSKTLEPMNPFERRIIHATVSEIEGVTSTSVGEEPNRRVIITSPTARPARGGKGGPRGPRRDDRPGERSGRSGAPRRRGGPPPRRESGRSNQGGSINTVSNAFPSQAGNEPPKRVEQEATDKPLYTKLDLE